MGLKETNDALALIAAHQAEADFEGNKSEDLIVRAEQALGVAFPPSYRRFLQELGCGDFAGFEIYGLISEHFDSAGIPDVVWITRRARSEWDLPQHLVLVSFDGSGSYYALDIARSSSADREAPILLWTPGASPQQSWPEMATDFGMFLLAQVRQSLGT